LPTKRMQEQAVVMVRRQVDTQAQQFQQLSNSPQAQQLKQSNPEQAQQLMASAQAEIQKGHDTIRKIASRPNIDQVLTFLHDNRARAFTLDIETDSTIIVDEQAEKEGRAEYMSVLSQLLPQLTQMFAGEPATGEFCGQVLKFATAPYRAGRTLDGAIDDLIELMKGKAEGPRPDDPTTATNKTALQIEQLKQQRAAQKDQADNAIKVAELKKRDEWEKLKISSSERIKVMELHSKQQDSGAKAMQANQDALHDREEHQATMLEKAAEMQTNRQEAAIRQADAIAKRNDMAARSRERMQAQQFRQMQAAQRPARPV
jgi:hypothetical protein